MRQESKQALEENRESLEIVADADCRASWIAETLLEALDEE